MVKGFLKEECVFDDHLYYKCSFSHGFYRILKNTCSDLFFSHVCDDDVAFYQICGHQRSCHADKKTNSLKVPPLGVCGDFLCQRNDIKVLTSTDTGRAFYPNSSDLFLTHDVNRADRCDGISNCYNTANGTAADEYNCTEHRRESSPGRFFCLCEGGVTVSKELVCNKVCDCSRCSDEAKCHNMTVGVVCRSRDCVRDYIQPHRICDGIYDCFHMTDEMDCNRRKEVTDKRECEAVNKVGNASRIRPLNSRNMCSISEGVNWRMFCDDYRDQMNCTGSLVSPLKCLIDGFLTTLSEFVLCKGPPLCDDHLDNACIRITFECMLHKHKLCDGVNDCPQAVDEADYFCGNLAEINCTRRLSYDKMEKTFPASWVMDGISDCVNGVDEDSTKWSRLCGVGFLNLFQFRQFHPTSECHSRLQLKCPSDHLRTLDLKNVCKGLSNCDLKLCAVSRQLSISLTSEKLTMSPKRLFYCFPGLKSLQRILGFCQEKAMQKGAIIFGEEPSQILIPPDYAKTVDCTDVFGMQYVYLTCTRQCRHQDVVCPITNLSPSSCLNHPAESRVQSLAANHRLALLLLQSDGSYQQKVFGCSNYQCRPWEKVCDLNNDCGDWSDEAGCSNNFKCYGSGEYIPKSRVCNGVFDCFDGSDECNDDCDSQTKIFQQVALYQIACMFGVLATVLNFIVIIHGIMKLLNIKSRKGRLNQSLILVVSFGDFLQGIFLLSLVFVERFVNHSTCITQYDWTTSVYCNILGAFSTVGSLISLYSMTILSFIRVCGIKSMIQQPKETSVKYNILLASGVFGILGATGILAAAPLFPILENFFVQSLNYGENPLFLGAPDKLRHWKIFGEFYGRLRYFDYSWETIRKLSSDMFVNGEVKVQNLGFYGSNGFCLFNYFVKEDNSQKWFSGFVLFSNLICVIIISISYIIVFSATAKSSALAGPMNNALLKRNRKAQRKIGILISTDVVAWIPFVFMCIINYTRLIDTSKWYSVFSIVILPCNSVINPLGIYDDIIYNYLMRAFKLFQLEAGWNYIRQMFAGASVEQEPCPAELTITHF